MEENTIKVYIKIDGNNCITNIDSSIFLQDITNWICIDEGNGDKYSHAQGMYFPSEKPLRDVRGRCNYKYVDNIILELSEKGKEELFPIVPHKKEPTKEEILEKQLLETQALVAELRYKTILKENGGM